MATALRFVNRPHLQRGARDTGRPAPGRRPPHDGLVFRIDPTFGVTLREFRSADPFWT
jgi:hypothetical protein